MNNSNSDTGSQILTITNGEQEPWDLKGVGYETRSVIVPNADLLEW
jgi:hypothetical protein